MQLSTYEMNQLKNYKLPVFFKTWEKRLSVNGTKVDIKFRIDEKRSLILITVFRENNYHIYDRLVIKCRHDVDTTILDCNSLFLKLL